MKVIDSLYKRLINHSLLSAHTLSLCRILLALFHLIFIFPEFTWVGKVPQAFFNPPFISIASFFDNIPPYSFFLALEILLFVSLIFVLLGVHTRKFLIICFIIGILGSSFRYSFGKIDHDIFKWLFFFLLAFTNSGSYMSLRPDRKLKSQTEKLAIAILAFCLVFAYFSAGFLKVIHWIDFDLKTSGFLNWFYSGYFLLNRDLLLADWVFYFPPIVFEFFDYTASLFEISGIVFLLWSQKSWHWYLIFALFFHGTVILFLNINFISLLPVLLVFLYKPKLSIVKNTEKKYTTILPILAILATLFFFINRFWLFDLIPDFVSLGISALVTFALFFYFLIKQLQKATRNHFTNVEN